MTPQRLIFLDETGAKTNMARLRGRSLAGQRLHASVPFGRWEITTFVAGLRLAGWMAPMVLDGAGASFKAYVERILAPKLRPGDLVVMDEWTRRVRSWSCGKPLGIALQHSSLRTAPTSSGMLAMVLLNVKVL